jgi:uncharacterized C2H2 Zn-finger protein
LVPNDVLRSKIAIYTAEIVEAILSDHPEIVDLWLKRLHKRYLELKKSCEFHNDPEACFNMPPLEQFEKHFQLWQDGGIITISIQRGKVIRIRNEKSKMGTTLALLVADRRSTNSLFVCSRCASIFASSEEYAKHSMCEFKAAKDEESKNIRTEEEESVRTKDIAPNPIWWLSYS